MSIIIPSLYGKNGYFLLAKDRFFSLKSPIQKTPEKESDLSSYLIAPLIDCLVLSPLSSIETLIHLVNAIGSLGRASYMWSMHARSVNSQNIDTRLNLEYIDMLPLTLQNIHSYFDHRIKDELNDAFSHLVSCAATPVFQLINVFLSLLSLIIRPFVSLDHLFINLTTSQIGGEDPSSYNNEYGSR